MTTAAKAGWSSQSVVGVQNRSSPALQVKRGVSMGALWRTIYPFGGGWGTHTNPHTPLIPLEHTTIEMLDKILTKSSADSSGKDPVTAKDPAKCGKKEVKSWGFKHVFTWTDGP